jgi:hypothetical protein
MVRKNHGAYAIIEGEGAVKANLLEGTGYFWRGDIPVPSMIGSLLSTRLKRSWVGRKV